MTQTTRLNILILLSLLLLPTTAHATTSLFRGVIIAVTADGVTVRLQWSNNGQDDMDVTLPIGTSSTVLLDDKISTIAEACQVGRAVVACRDVSLFLCYTNNWELQRPTTVTDQANAWWTIRLPQAINEKLVVTDKDKSRTKTKPFTGDLLLHLDIVAGKVAAGFATRRFKGGGNMPWYEIDAAKLTFADNTLSGSIDLHLVPHSSNRTMLSDNPKLITSTYALHIHADEQGKLSGSFKHSGRNKQGSIHGQVSDLPKIGPSWSCWGRVAVLEQGWWFAPQYVSFGRNVDGPTSDCWTTSKAKGRTLTVQQATIVDKKLTAELGIIDDKKEWKLIIDANLVGDRYYGTATRSGDGSTITGRIAGRITHSGAPTWDQSESKAEDMVKSIRAGNSKP